MTQETDTTNLTDDVFLGGQLKLLQPAKGFRAGSDAVLLAAAVEIVPGRATRVLDAGAGIGTAGLCVAARCPEAQVTLAEIAPSLAALAAANVSRNGLDDRVGAVATDLCGGAERLAAAGLSAGAFEQIIANPPYLETGRHRLPTDDIAAGAFGMAPDGLDNWMRALVRLIARGGTLTLIHRADALAKVLDALDGRFGGAAVLPVHPRAGEPAHRIIVTARQGSRAPLQILAGLVLHGPDNAFLPAIDAIMRDGAPLPWPKGRMR